MPVYTYKTVIKLHETDAAGLLFFSHQFKLVHDAYEALLETIGFGFAILLTKKKYFLPIVHAEADYKAPLFVGDRITIEIAIERIGETSFIFVYKLLNEQKHLVGTAKTVHVTVNKKTQKKISLPNDMRKALEKLRGRK